jgi:hypothetical protein
MNNIIVLFGRLQEIIFSIYALVLLGIIIVLLLWWNILFYIIIELYKIEAHPEISLRNFPRWPQSPINMSSCNSEANFKVLIQGSLDSWGNAGTGEKAGSPKTSPTYKSNQGLNIVNFDSRASYAPELCPSVGQ